MTTIIRLAQTATEHEEGLALIQQKRNQWGLPNQGKDGLWMPKQIALPSSNLIVALDGETLVGALALLGDNPLRLPASHKAPFSHLKKSLGKQRLAEISVTSVSRDYLPKETALTFALHHFANCFGRTYCQYDAFVLESTLDWSAAFSPLLGFQDLDAADSSENIRNLFKLTSDNFDLRSTLRDFPVEFQFPEKKFLLLSHESMKPEVFSYLFLERTNFFEQLSDIEIRVFKNIYDFGKYAKFLPEKNLNIPFKQLPKHRRYSMNCEGFVRMPDGKNQNLQVIDVSKDGLKIHHEDQLPPGCHSLVIYIGLRKRAEVIARSVWIDEMAQISGLEIKSGDSNWQNLIQFLEKEEAKDAA